MTGSTVSDPQHDTNPQNKPELHSPAKDPPNSLRVSHRGLGVPAFRRRLCGELAAVGLHDRTGPAGSSDPDSIQNCGRSWPVAAHLSPPGLISSAAHQKWSLPRRRTPGAPGPSGTTDVGHLTGA